MTVRQLRDLLGELASRWDNASVELDAEMFGNHRMSKLSLIEVPAITLLGEGAKPELKVVLS